MEPEPISADRGFASLLRPKRFRSTDAEPLMRVSYAQWRPDLELHDFPCEEGKEDQVEVQRAT
jgi:hypothetical protein